MIDEVKKKKAVFYARVSTMSDGQAESISNQIDLKNSYMRRHMDEYEIVSEYTEKISGKSDERPEFQKMLDKISEGDIDFIMCKDLKRISRSQEVSAGLRRMAKDYHFKFIILSTGQIIDPNENENRMLYGFESLINEEVVYRQSEYGRIVHRQKCEAKKLGRQNQTFGYRWNKAKREMEVYEPEAQVVSKIFDRYVFANEGIKDIRKWLSTMDMHYANKTVTKWLQETAYIGKFTLNKVGSELHVGKGGKTVRYIKPREEWVIVETPELAIVDIEVFELAQRIRESRLHLYDSSNAGQKREVFKGSHLFSGKIFCNECGYSYVHGYSDRAKKIGIYRDSYNLRKRNALEKCSNTEYKRVYEEDIKRITVIAINGIIREGQSCIPILMKSIEKAIRMQGNFDKQIKSKEISLKKLKDKAFKIQDAFLDASKEMRVGLNLRLAETNNQMNQVETDIKKLRNTEVSESAIKKQLSRIQQSVNSWLEIDTNMLTRKVVDQFILKIIVHNDGQLDIFLNGTNDVEHNHLPDYKTNRKCIKGKKENSEESSLSNLTGNVNYKYGQEMYEEEAKKIVDAIASTKTKNVDFTLLQFEIDEKNAGRPRKGETEFRELEIQVDSTLNVNG